ncbi:MAG: hypothetical protein J0H68_04405 [Sphingobacteriia bacterium]|nr:hypothetical protein [Sphingobacteriia bacterium]
MIYENVAKKYLEAIQEHDYNKVMSLFDEKGLVNSPMTGEVKAEDFFKAYFDDEYNAIVSLKEIFISKFSSYSLAINFEYKAISDAKETISIDCVDIIKLNKEGKIIYLNVIFDTHETRILFKKLKLFEG